MMDTLWLTVIQLAIGQAGEPDTAAAVETTSAMTPVSWAYMVLVWGLIIALNVFCFYRLFARGKDTPHMG